MPVPPEIMILPLKHFICNTAAFAAKDIIVVYSALRDMGNSLEQVEIAVFNHMVRVILLPEQTAGAAPVFSVEVDTLKNF